MKDETPTGMTPGTLLKTVRQQQGLTVVEAATRLCLSVQTIEDIERDDYSQMVAKVYARGHVISYAHILGIPEAKILSTLANVQMEFEPAKNPVSIDNEKSIPIYQSVETSQQRSGLILWGILILIILVGLIVIWWWGSSTPPDKASATSVKRVSLQLQQPPPPPATSTSAALPIPEIATTAPASSAPVTTQPDELSKSVSQPLELRDTENSPGPTANLEPSIDLPLPRTTGD